MKVKWLIPVCIGQRVVFPEPVDCDPFFVIPAETTGEVVFVNPDRGVCCVKMEQLIEGGEDVDNEIYFNVRGASLPEDNWYVLEDVAWPLPHESNNST